MISILQHFLFGFDGIHLRAETLLLSAFYIILSIKNCLKRIKRFCLEEQIVAHALNIMGLVVANKFESLQSAPTRGTDLSVPSK